MFEHFIFFFLLLTWLCSAVNSCFDKQCASGMQVVNGEDYYRGDNENNDTIRSLSRDETAINSGATPE